MQQQADLRDNWSMVEGPSAGARREHGVLPNCEWIMIDKEATKAVPNMSWADVARTKADPRAIEEAQQRLQQQQWTQISSPNPAPAQRRERVACPYDSDEDTEEAKYQTSRKRSVDLNASRAEYLLRTGGGRKYGRKNGRYANRVFGRQYDVYDDREVTREMKQKPGMWGR